MLLNCMVSKSSGHCQLSVCQHGKHHQVVIYSPHHLWILPAHINSSSWFEEEF
jgi:hypothetical protein